MWSKRTCKFTLVLLPLFILTACGPSEAQIVAAIEETFVAGTATAAAQATNTATATNTPTVTLTPTPTSTDTPTPTPTDTDTPTPTNTPTTIPETATASALETENAIATEAVVATQTQYAANITATQDSRNATATKQASEVAATQTQRSVSITATRAVYSTNVAATQAEFSAAATERASYEAIGWQELVTYPKSHIGERIFIRGRIFNINSNTEFQMFVGNYEAVYIKMDEPYDDLFENQWVTVYGVVRDEICGTNSFGGEVCQPLIIGHFYER